jgi:hypothetical protein
MRRPPGPAPGLSVTSLTIPPSIGNLGISVGGSGSGSGMTGAKRQAIACHFCRNRKLKCDGEKPCRHCERRKLECTYEEVARKRGKGKKARREPSKEDAHPRQHHHQSGPSSADGTSVMKKTPPPSFGSMSRTRRQMAASRGGASSAAEQAPAVDVDLDRLATPPSSTALPPHPFNPVETQSKRDADDLSDTEAGEMPSDRGEQQSCLGPLFDQLD